MKTGQRLRNRYYTLETPGLKQAANALKTGQDPKAQFSDTGKRLLTKVLANQENPYVTNYLQSFELEANEVDEFQQKLSQQFPGFTTSIAPALYDEAEIKEWLAIEEDERQYEKMGDEIKDKVNDMEYQALKAKIDSENNVRINAVNRIVMTDPTNILTTSPLSKAVVLSKKQQRNAVIIIENELDNSFAWETRFCVAGLAFKNQTQLIPGHVMLVVTPTDLTDSYQKGVRIYPEKAIFNDLQNYYTAFTAINKCKEPVVVPTARSESLVHTINKFELRRRQQRKQQEGNVEFRVVKDEQEQGPEYQSIMLTNRISLFPAGVAVFKQNILIVSALQTLGAMMAGWSIEDIDFHGLTGEQCKYLQNFFVVCAKENMSYAQITKTLELLAAGDQNTIELFAGNIGEPALWQIPQNNVLTPTNTQPLSDAESEQLGKTIAAALFTCVNTADYNYLISFSQSLPEGELKAHLQRMVYIKFDTIVDVRKYLTSLSIETLNKSEQVILQNIQKHFIAVEQAVLEPNLEILKFLFENVEDVAYVKDLFEKINERYVELRQEKDYRTVLLTVLTHTDYLNRILAAIKEPVKKLEYLDNLFVINSKDSKFIEFLQKKYLEVAAAHPNNLMLRSYIKDDKGLLKMDISNQTNTNFHAKTPRPTFRTEIQEVLDKPLVYSSRDDIPLDRHIVERSHQLLIGAMKFPDSVTKHNWKIYIDRSVGSDLIIRFPAPEYAKRLANYLSENMQMKVSVPEQKAIWVPVEGDKSTGPIGSEIHIPANEVDRYLKEVLRLEEKQELKLESEQKRGLFNMKLLR